MQDLVEAMQERTVPQGCHVIREGERPSLPASPLSLEENNKLNAFQPPTVAGETGSYLYVAAEGQFEVCKAGRVLGNLGVGKVFGELAILYNCKRTASIRAVVDSKVWALERRVFQQVMVSSGLRRMVHQVV